MTSNSSLSQPNDARKTGGQPPPADALQQTRLGKYELTRPLGSGGMGTVYLATDTEEKRTVALKILPRDKAANPALVKRFQAEAEAAAQLKHENIVSVYDAGKADGYLYIALEYVQGTDVHKLLKKRGRLPLRRTLEIVKQVARALDHAFRRGIVHRDIKPSNMLIKRNGTVKLADMGLARSVDETTESGLTRVGTTVGTVDYMAPEQARDSKSADVRSDIYSLGCAWYHMLTGSAPFPQGSITNKLYAHIAEERPDPRDKNPQLPQEIANIVRKMMSRKARNRYQTPGELLEVLERVSFRSDAFSNRFLSVLSDVVDEELQAEVQVEPSPRRSRRPLRRTRRRSRGAAADPAEFFYEFLRVFGIVLLGLIAATALWWGLVGWISVGTG